MDEQEYYRNLKQTQDDHLRRINSNPFNFETYRPSFQPCMHDQCSECHGTGLRSNGTYCIHNLSCPCPKCTPYSLY